MLYFYMLPLFFNRKDIFTCLNQGSWLQIISIMGKQYNKVIKRRRRKAYLRRQKEQVKNNSGTKSATAKKDASAKKDEPAKKAAAKKAPAKKAPAKKAAKKVTSGKEDLTKIEGVGPKIAETLVNAGVKTFADLAAQEPAKISEIISEVRGNHIPDTWPQQAKLAADGKWDELKTLQDELDGGKPAK